MKKERLAIIGLSVISALSYGLVAKTILDIPHPKPKAEIRYSPMAELMGRDFSYLTTREMVFNDDEIYAQSGPERMQWGVYRNR